MSKTVGIVSTSNPIAIRVKNYIKRINAMEQVEIITDLNNLTSYLKYNKPNMIIVESNCWHEITPHIILNIAEKHPRLNIAIFSFEEFTPSQAACYTRMGAGSFIDFRYYDDDDILNAIRVVLSGKTFVPDWIKNAKLQYDSNNTEKARLLPKEMDVFRLLALGNSVETIAFKMNIREAVVRNYRQSIHNKLGIHSQTQILAQAIRLGVVGLDEISPVIGLCRKIIEDQNKFMSGGETS
jgi:DNA-binding NarL/FixJ family response regulator